MTYNFDEIIDRNNTYSIKYNFKKKYPLAPPDSIPMWIADMDFACPQEIVDSIVQCAEKNRLFGYSNILEEEFFNCVVNYMQRHFDWNVKKESICFSNGIVPALKNLTALLTKPDEKVIFQTPCYVHFETDIKSIGRERVYNPMIEKDGKFFIDFDDFEKKCQDEKTTLFILCSPHNPTGRVWTKEELTKLSEICFANNVKILSDEIHFDLLRKGAKHIVLDSLFDHDSRIFTCTAPSKTFNIAGLQLSNIIINDEKIRDLWVDNEISGIPNPLSIYACIGAYTKCDNWLDALRDYLDENFNAMKKFVDSMLPKAKLEIPQGTFLAWLDVRDYGLTCKELDERTQRKGVLVQGAPCFIHNSEGFLRINIGLPKVQMLEGLNRLKKALEE